MMNEETFLYRQVNPDYYLQEGTYSSQVFTPRPADEGLLSVFDGGQISAEDSFMKYNQRMAAMGARPSVGVAGVQVRDCLAYQGLELHARLDPNEDFAEHSVIDFTASPSRSQTKKAAEFLKGRAMQHGEGGWMHRPQS